METLTIQQIAPYIPYKLKVFYKDKIWPVTGINMRTEFEFLSFGPYELNFYECKPILYPISCITKPIEHNGETFIPIVELARISYNEKQWVLSDGKAVSGGYGSRIVFYYDGTDFICGDDESPMHVFKQQLLYQKLAEWGVNFNGIPEGLYIDKQTFK